MIRKRRTAALLSLLAMVLTVTSAAFAAPICDTMTDGHSSHRQHGGSHTPSMPDCPHALAPAGACTQMGAVTPTPALTPVSEIRVAVVMASTVVPHSRLAALIFHPPRA